MTMHVETEPQFSNSWQLRFFRLNRLTERISLAGILKIKSLPNGFLTALEKVQIKLRNLRFLSRAILIRFGSGINLQINGRFGRYLSKMSIFP
jgi:hypothetical protein